MSGFERHCIVLPLLSSEPAGPRVPPGPGLLLPLGAVGGDDGGAEGQEDEDAARLDDLLSPRHLPGGRHGPLHGSLLLGT